MMAQKAPKPKPCDFKPLDGATLYGYDSSNKEHCKDVTLAELYASTWLGSREIAKLSAADLNNVGCACMWLLKPNVALAYLLFGAASEKSKNDTIIMNNKVNAKKLLGDDGDQPGTLRNPGGSAWSGTGSGGRVRVPSLEIPGRGVKPSPKPPGLPGNSSRPVVPHGKHPRPLKRK